MLVSMSMTPRPRSRPSAHTAAISPTLDTIVILKILIRLADEVSDAFAHVQRKLDAEQVRVSVRSEMSNVDKRSNFSRPTSDCAKCANTRQKGARRPDADTFKRVKNGWVPFAGVSPITPVKPWAARFEAFACDHSNGRRHRFRASTAHHMCAIHFAHPARPNGGDDFVAVRGDSRRHRGGESQDCLGRAGGLQETCESRGGSWSVTRLYPHPASRTCSVVRAASCAASRHWSTR